MSEIISKAKLPPLSPKSDYIFKLIFGDTRNIDILQSFLEAVLDLPKEEFEKITIVDPFLKREDAVSKQGILDIKIRTKNGKIIHVEIQVEDVPNMKERLVFYIAKLVAGQIARGNDYDVIKRVISAEQVPLPI